MTATQKDFFQVWKVFGSNNEKYMPQDNAVIALYSSDTDKAKCVVDKNFKSFLKWESLEFEWKRVGTASEWGWQSELEGKDVELTVQIIEDAPNQLHCIRGRLDKPPGSFSGSDEGE